MKSLFLSLFSLFIAFSVKAQHVDSITFCKQVWQEQHVKKGIVWKQTHFQHLFGGEQEINLIEIDLRRHLKNLRLAGLSIGTKLSSSFAQEKNAIVASNGGFFNTKIGGAHDFIKINGTVVNVSSNKHPRANAYLAFDKRTIQIIPQTKDSLRETALDNVLLSGPLLLDDGLRINIKNDKFNRNKHPRTAIALKDHTLILLTVDGRNKKSHGLSLHELSQLLAWYDCDKAMNLDGGGSTTLYIKGQPDDGIVNYPSDNKTFDHQGERPVANIIYIKD